MFNNLFASHSVHIFFLPHCLDPALSLHLLTIYFLLDYEQWFYCDQTDLLL